MAYNSGSEWQIEYTDEFGEWWSSLPVKAQDAIDSAVQNLARIGPGLGRPWVDTLKASRHPNMKELRVQQAGTPYRICFAFDPRRCAILLIGGDKTGDKRFYEWIGPLADQLYDEHLDQLRTEGLIP